MSHTEPNWVDFKYRRPGAVPEAAYKWLRDESSLTMRVIDFCQGQFRVRVLHQGWAKPLASEAKLLNVSVSDTAMIREVELQCNEHPLVFARTIIPAASLTGEARKLSYLGDKPLGAMLFADPATKRKRVQIARILPRHPMYAAAVDHLLVLPSDLWGRRTLFVYAGKPILVNEIFLPGITENQTVLDEPE